MNPKTQALSSDVRQRRILAAFTPVEESVYEGLPADVRRDHWTDLKRRLMIACEIAAPGRGGTLADRAINTLPPDEALLCMDALLQYGRMPSELTADEERQASRAEIRQEIQHFDRIMDLDSMVDGRSSLKKRRDFVHSAGLLGAAERLFVLVQERVGLRSSDAGHWLDLGAQPQRLLKAHPQGQTLVRTSPPYLAVAVEGDQPACERAAALLERYTIKHTLPVALGLLDYEWFLDGHPEVQLAAVVLQKADDRLFATVWAAGGTSILAVTQRGFVQSVEHVQSLVGSAIGAQVPRYGAETLALPADAWLCLLADAGATGAHPSLSAALNAKNPSGRIYLNENIAALAPDAPVAIAKGTAIRPYKAAGLYDLGSVAHALARVTTSTPCSGIRVALECGHVHADREVGPAQRRGIDLAVRFIEAWKAELAARGTTLTLEVTPMVDDDHVDNRLSYQRYRELFSSAGLTIDDLILESSPIIRAVAHDVLKRALLRDGDGFQLEEVGGNLHLASNGMRLELIEDLRGSMRNGCVMFEIALTMYRVARAELTGLFWARAGGVPFELHRAMEEEYDALEILASRQGKRQDFDLLYVSTWDQVQSTGSSTPFFDAYEKTLARGSDRGEHLIALNILEDYYRPQQEKVQRLASLLDIPLPLEAVFFSPHGDGLALLNTPAS
ncbi:MAG TPA: hypothetical protein VGW38_04320 [Chloroflexota bacterium]|nr:hypothetical protein [Chloroflexota bacterium]